MRLKNTKVKSNKQEKRVAKEIQGKTTIASGALYIQKADVRNDMWLCECKTTEKNFYSLKEKTFDKVYYEAIKDGLRMPVMCIDLLDGKHSIAVMRYLDFVGLSLDVKAVYVGNPVPILVEKASYRFEVDKIFDDMYQSIDNIETKNPFCRRQDIKFLKTGHHLVVLEWNDFVNLVKDL